MRQNYFEDCLKKIEYSRQDGKIASAQAKELQLDVMNKTEQKRKLDQDFALGKIDAKLYNEWDANIRRDISGISNRVDFLGELHRKEERKKKSLAVIGVAAAIGGVCAFFAVPQYLHAHRTIAGIPEPIQINIDVMVSEAEKKGEKIEKGKTISGDGYRAEMNYLASYDIKGLVVEVDDYDGNGAQAFDKAIPRDRKLKREYDGSIFQKYPITREDIASTSSNNHILVDDDRLYRKLKRVRIGDYIEMKGYLVEAVISDDLGRNPYKVSSSLVRNDYSTSVFDTRTSCEIMYITDLEWLD